MYHIVFMAFISGILLAGCSGNEEYLDLKGIVLDEKTKVNIPNRKIIVQALEQRDNKLFPFYIGEFCTDSSGHFVYSLLKIKNIYLYEFDVVGDSSYAFSSNKIGLTELRKFGKFLSFPLSKLADLTIAIESKSKAPYIETLYLSWRSNGMDGKKLYPYTINNYGIKNSVSTLDMTCKWIGGDIKSAIKTKVFADKETIVHWELFRYGKVKEFTDTIFCKRDVFNYVYFNY